MSPFHSPSPWTLRSGGGALTIESRDRHVVAILGRHMDESNGPLLTAAPELVEELRAMLIALPNHSPDCKGKSVAGAACCFYAERHRNARAALAKAVGR